MFPGGKFANQWHHLQIDSRTVRITNKKRLQGWIDAYGLDSDFVRVRVLGQFPRKGSLMEFFSAADIDEAMTREVYTDKSDPLPSALTLLAFGMNASVIFPRKGRDARTIERERFNGLSTVELADRILQAHFRYHADGIMIDGGGVGGGVVDNVRNKRLHCYEVQFGGQRRSTTPSGAAPARNTPTTAQQCTVPAELGLKPGPCPRTQNSSVRCWPSGTPTTSGMKSSSNARKTLSTKTARASPPRRHRRLGPDLRPSAQSQPICWWGLPAQIPHRHRI